MASDTKTRVTIIPTVSARGRFAPLFTIIGHSTKNVYDLRGTTVIKTLHTRPFFTAADGWSLELWVKQLRPGTPAYRCPYLIHTSGHVITSQKKAWNDTARMVMMIDTLLGPYVRDKCDGKAAIWMDNCRIHAVEEVADYFKQYNIEPLFYPPNMTLFLQVLDLVVNKLIKNHTRSCNANRIVTAFLTFRDLLLKAQQEATALPLFKPPAPTTYECIRDVIQFIQTYDTQPFLEPYVTEGEEPTAVQRAENERFVKCHRARQTIQKSFIDSGSYHRGDNTFTQFKYSKELGTMNESLVKAEHVVSYDQGPPVVPLAAVIFEALSGSMPAQDVAEVAVLVDPTIAEVDVDGTEALDEEGYWDTDSDTDDESSDGELDDDEI